MSSRAARPPRTPVIDSLVRFWRSDSGLSTFSASLVVLVFVLPPFLQPSAGGRLLGKAAFAVMLVSGVLALSERGYTWRLLMVGSAASVAILLASTILPVAEPAILVAELVSVVLLLVAVLGQTFRAGPVTLHRMLGGIAAYLLLGLAWAESYELLERLQPGSFSGALGAAGEHRGWVYFSFVTLTTVGYGDILPVHPAARSLAMLEAVTGPLYIAILLARLVSVAEITRAQRSRKGSGGD